jgi:hypothetical protein
VIVEEGSATGPRELLYLLQLKKKKKSKKSWE